MQISIIIIAISPLLLHLGNRPMRLEHALAERKVCAAEATRTA